MSAASRALPPKLGKYEVRREVGRGGMGVVYEGFDPLINRRVALKTFISEFFDGTQSDNLLTRLRREIFVPLPGTAKARLRKPAQATDASIRAITSADGGPASAAATHSASS